MMTITHFNLRLVTGGLYVTALLSIAQANPQIAPKPNSSTQSQAPVISRAAYDPHLTKNRIAFWQKRVQADPTGSIALRELAGAYLARGRETGDIAYAVQAEAAARKSLEAVSGEGNSAALLRLASSLLTQHRFPEALAVAERAAAINAEAYRLRADIAIEIGNLALAEESLARIPLPRNDPKRRYDLNYKALRAHFLEAKGEEGPALALRREAARQADQLADMPAETAAWYHVMVGHSLLDKGKLEEGERECRKALQIFPLDYRAMTGLAEGKMWRGDWKGTLAWAQKSISIAPQNPEVLLLLGEAYTKLGNPKAAERQYELLGALWRSFPRIYDRHWILFCADQKRDLPSAIALARRDLNLRQDAGAYDALAWVCYKAGLLPEARQTIKKALQRGGDAGTFYHAAMIAHSSGDRAQARSYLSQARADNPYFLKTVDLPASLKSQSG